MSPSCSLESEQKMHISFFGAVIYSALHGAQIFFIG
jgi:hypothetical protein